MFHYINRITDNFGNGQAGWTVKAFNMVGGVAGTEATMYGPDGVTGVVGNRAVSDGGGNFDFYIADGTYAVVYYDPSGFVRRTEPGVAMYTYEQFLAEGQAVLDGAAQAAQGANDALGQTQDAASQALVQIQTANDAAIAAVNQIKLENLGILQQVIAIRDQIAAGGGTVTPTPAPTFTTQPNVSPSSGNAGATFTATPGVVANGAISARAWLLNGTSISTGLTAVPSAAGTLTYQETAVGAGGTVQSNVVSVMVGATASASPSLAGYSLVLTRKGERVSAPLTALAA